MNKNEFLEIIKTRRSVRSFENSPMPHSDIDTIIEAASWAPSGSNLQNWRFIAVESSTIKEALIKAVKDKVTELSLHITSATAKKEFESYSNYFTFFAEAPCVVAVVQKPYDSLSTRIMSRYKIAPEQGSTAGIQGPSAAIENLLLAAHALGYGGCWMTGPLIARNEMEQILQIQKPDQLMAIIPLGKPAKQQPAPKRKPLSDILEYK